LVPGRKRDRGRDSKKARRSLVVGSCLNPMWLREREAPKEGVVGRVGDYRVREGFFGGRFGNLPGEKLTKKVGRGGAGGRKERQGGKNQDLDAITQLSEAEKRKIPLKRRESRERRRSKRGRTYRQRVMERPFMFTSDLPKGEKRFRQGGEKHKQKGDYGETS